MHLNNTLSTFNLQRQSDDASILSSNRQLHRTTQHEKVPWVRRRETIKHRSPSSSPYLWRKEWTRLEEFSRDSQPHEFDENPTRQGHAGSQTIVNKYKKQGSYKNTRNANYHSSSNCQTFEESCERNRNSLCLSSMNRSKTGVLKQTTRKGPLVSSDTKRVQHNTRLVNLDGIEYFPLLTPPPLLPCKTIVPATDRKRKGRQEIHLSGINNESDEQGNCASTPDPAPKLQAYYDLPWKDREKIRISDTYDETY